jgi:hypothetical protein
MKVEQTQCSETSVIKHHTPENNTKGYTRHTEYDENLKSKVYVVKPNKISRYFDGTQNTNSFGENSNSNNKWLQHVRRMDIVKLRPTVIKYQPEKKSAQ